MQLPFRNGLRSLSFAVVLLVSSFAPQIQTSMSPSEFSHVLCLHLGMFFGILTSRVFIQSFKYLFFLIVLNLRFMGQMSGELVASKGLNIYSPFSNEFPVK